MNNNLELLNFVARPSDTRRLTFFIDLSYSNASPNVYAILPL